MYDDVMEMHMNPLPHFNSTFAWGRVWPYGAPFVNLLFISLLAFFYRDMFGVTEKRNKKRAG